MRLREPKGPDDHHALVIEDKLAEQPAASRDHVIGDGQATLHGVQTAAPCLEGGFEPLDLCKGDDDGAPPATRTAKAVVSVRGGGATGRSKGKAKCKDAGSGWL